MVARMPMMSTTTISSASVKPRRLDAERRLRWQVCARNIILVDCSIKLGPPGKFSETAQNTSSPERRQARRLHLPTPIMPVFLILRPLFVVAGFTVVEHATERLLFEPIPERAKANSEELSSLSPHPSRPLERFHEQASLHFREYFVESAPCLRQAQELHRCTPGQTTEF